jgi:MtN3 and saliva related transmembrane protein|tara:strand:+ start:13714 stop:13989 length:276 start_codon:yes stop_codon:yes gene_type:complete
MKEHAMGLPFETILGLVAGSLTTLAFLPQVIRTWRTRSTADISLGMFLVLCTGIALWFVYGLINGDWPVIIANGLTFLLAAIILGFKLRHG